MARNACAIRVSRAVISAAPRQHRGKSGTRQRGNTLWAFDVNPDTHIRFLSRHRYALASPRRNEQTVLKKADLNAGKALGLSQAELAEVIGRDRSGFARGGIDPAGKAGELALLFIRCYRGLFVLVGGRAEDMVDDLAKQVLLEDLLDATKPVPRPGTEGLHYLFATPFRYPPLRHGSRFGTRFEPSIFRGARGLETVLAEAANYRFVFWTGMATAPASGRLVTQHAPRARYRNDRAVLLTELPCAVHAEVLAHPSDYGPTRALGRAPLGFPIEQFLVDGALPRQAGYPESRA